MAKRNGMQKTARWQLGVLGVCRTKFVISKLECTRTKLVAPVITSVAVHSSNKA